MKTNLEVDDTLIHEALLLGGYQTDKAVVELGKYQKRHLD